MGAYLATEDCVVDDHIEGSAECLLRSSYWSSCSSVNAGDLAKDLRQLEPQPWRHAARRHIHPRAPPLQLRVVFEP